MPTVSTRARCAGVALLALAACGRIIAPAPPSATADASDVAMFSGAPIAIAARAARVLTDLSYTTKRFGSDSTWGFRATDSVHARLRYAPAGGDSTRVLLELWGRCGRETRCRSGDGAGVLLLIGQADPIPQ